MAQEKFQKAVEAWNGLSAEQKQGVWNGVVERLSKVNISELSLPEQLAVDGGNGALLAAFGPLGAVIAGQQAAEKITSETSSN